VPALAHVLGNLLVVLGGRSRRRLVAIGRLGEGAVVVRRVVLAALLGELARVALVPLLDELRVVRELLGGTRTMSQLVLLG